MRGIKALALSVAMLFPWLVASQTTDILPRDGQPAANILASHDLWGNPTFIGSITNKGPDSQSVW